MDVAKPDRVVLKKPAPKPPISNEHLRPLDSGESLWDMRIHLIHFGNILGGFVPNKEQEGDESKRSKGTRRKKRRQQKKKK